MRDVKSINYFEQMKGRGTRTIDLDSLRKVTPTAKFTKDHFVIVDAIGVTKSLKTDCRPLEKKPGVPLKDLLQAIAVGAREEELFTSLANRLTRLDKQLTEKEKTEFAEKANGKSVSQVVKELLNAFNPDEVIHVGWGKDNTKKGEEIIANFLDWMLENKDELLVLQIFYNQPYRRRELTHNMVKEVLDKLQNDKPNLSPMTVRQAYATTGLTPIESTLNPLTALVSLIRKVCGLDSSLTAYDKTVDRNFQAWILKKIAGQHNAFSEEQMQWLRMAKDYVSNSFHIDKDEFDLYPLNRNGGLGKFYQRFREDYEKIIEESDEALAA
jgi:type I restriction enzyme R subunit